MKIIFSLTFISFILTINAQTWSGSTPGNIYYNQGYVGLGTTPSNPLHIEYNINSGSLLYGLNNQPMGTNAMSYSPNLFLFHTRLDACLGLHAYVYRKSASTSWTGGIVRLSSAADGHGYSQDHHYNNLNWIDFIGNGYGIDLGCNNNDPAISIRDKQVGIGTTTPMDGYKLDVNGKMRASYYNLNAYSTNYDDFALYVTTDIGTTLSSAGSTNIAFRTNNAERLRIGSTGNVLIGKTTQTNTTYKLDVAGKIRADEITVNTTGADFVFAPTYKLRTLAEVEAFIKANKHLPDVAPAADMQTNGVSMGDMQAKLLQKVEELTLYVIELKKENEEIKKKVTALENR